MTSLDWMGVQSTNIISIITAFLILNVMLTLFITHRFLEERRKNRIAAKSSVDEISVLIDYLLTQFQNTKNYNQSSDPGHKPLSREVVHLRSAYLKIEEKALAHRIGSSQYWQYLNENLLKLVKILFPHAVKKNDEVAALEARIAGLKDRVKRIPNDKNNAVIEQHKNRTIASLDGITAQHVEKRFDKTTLESKLRKLETVLDVFENPEARKAYLIKKKQRHYFSRSDQQIDQLNALSKENFNDVESLHQKMGESDILDDELHKFKTENEKLSQQISQLKSELSKFQDRMRLVDSADEFSDREKPRITAAELTDITDELIKANEDEIERLRDVIANQRTSIIQMEENLGTLGTPDQTAPFSHQTEIDSLQRCIKESEICINMLERELDDLKAHIVAIQGSDMFDFSEAESEELSNEVKQLRAEIENSRSQLGNYEQLLSYTTEALTASSIEDISLLVYETIAGLSFSPQLLIKSPDRTLELSPQGALQTREKVLISNMQINEINPGNGGQLSFRFLNIAGIIRPADSGVIDDADQQIILKTLQITNKIISLLTQAQKGKLHNKARDETINSIKHIYSDLDKMIEDHDGKADRIINRNFKQILDIARVKGMTATQVAGVHTIEQETIQQLRAANTLRLKARKRFLALMKTLEDAQ